LQAAQKSKPMILSQDGDGFILKAGPTPKVLNANSLGEPVYASPAISNGNILIRGERNLYCIFSNMQK
jgi:outer membrane protein assembly factor BamB